MKLSKFIGEKIKLHRNSRKWSQEQLAEMLSTTKQTVSRYENGDRQVNQDILFELSSIFNVCVDDFFPQREREETPLNPYSFFPTAAISAGYPSTVEGVTQAEKISIADKVMGKYAGDEDVFITRINGDSMDKVIPDNSLIAVKPITIDNLKDGDIVVFSNDHDYSVKYYYRHGDKIIFKPHSNNLSHHEQHFSYDEEVVIHGKVIMYIVNLH